MCGITAVLSSSGAVSTETMHRGTAALASSRPRRTGALDLARLPRRARPHPALDHRPHHRRSADRERGRVALDRRERRVLRFRAIRDEPPRRGPQASAPDPTARSRCTSTRTYGPECLHHLRGEFAFAIWDGRNRRLFAGRDRFGVKPLFYAEHDGALYLASEVKALFAMGVPARWSAESVYAGGFIVPGERTLFDGVHAVPPGHYLRATRGGAPRCISTGTSTIPRDDAAPAGRVPSASTWRDSARCWRSR